jgi:hypothetical protein
MKGWTWGWVRGPWRWMHYPATEAGRLREEALVSDALEPKDRLVLRKDLLQVETASRGMVFQSISTAAQSIGVFFLVAGLVGTCANWQLAQQGESTDRFTKAIEQLGSVRDAPDGHRRCGTPRYAFRKVSRSALMVLASVVGMPWGKPA